MDISQNAKTAHIGQKLIIGVRRASQGTFKLILAVRIT
jgi:hypothetical protein